MSGLTATLSILFTAMFAENAVFVRGYTSGALDFRRMTARSLLYDGASTTALCLLAAISSWTGNALISVIPAYAGMDSHLRPPVYMLVYALLFLLIHLLLAKVNRLRRFGLAVTELHTAIAFGFVPLGVLLITGIDGYKLLEAVIFALGTGIGYFLAMEVAVELHRRLKLCAVPQFLRGLPISLIVMGLAGMGLFVLMGHEIAL